MQLKIRLKDPLESPRKPHLAGRQKIEIHYSQTGTCLRVSVTIDESELLKKLAIQQTWARSSSQRHHLTGYTICHAGK